MDVCRSSKISFAKRPRVPPAALLTWPNAPPSPASAAERRALHSALQCGASGLEIAFSDEP